MRSEGSRRADRRRVVRPGGASTALPPASPVPASRRRDLGGAGPPGPAPNSRFPLWSYAIAPSSPRRKSVPFAHMRCSTPASLRASATFARFMPRRLATPVAQRLSAETPLTRVSIAFAASYSAVRTVASPTLLIPPVTSVSPDWYRFGVSPKCAPTASAVRNRPGSSTAALNVIATSAPTPGTVISRRQTVSSRTMASIRRCRRANSARRPSRARSIAPITARRPSRARSIAPVTASSISCPATGSSTLAANRPLLTSPTLSPKPRSRPRMLSSTSHRAGQVIEASRARLAAVALPLTLGVVAPVADHRGAAAGGAADAVGPALLPHQGVALRVVDQGREVHEAGRGHGLRPIRGGGLPLSTGCRPARHPLTPNTPDPEKSLRDYY